MKYKVPAFLLERSLSDSYTPGRESLRIPFIERGLQHLASVIKADCIQWETASRNDFFQRIDARVKILFLLFYVIIVSVKKEVLPEVLIGAFVFALTVISRLNVFRLYKRVLFFGFVFGFLVALPSAFNFITRGEIVLPVFHLSKSYRFWIYQIPKEIGLTREGICGVMMLTSRVMNSLALSFFVLYTTPFPDIIRALKTLRIPDSFLVIVSLTYKYIFIFAKTVEDMHLAKKSRLVKEIGNAEARRWIAERIAFVFRKSTLRCEDIFKAMVGRGFSDNIKIYPIGRFRARDLVAGAVAFLVGGLFLWM